MEREECHIVKEVNANPNLRDSKVAAQLPSQVGRCVCNYSLKIFLMFCHWSQHKEMQRFLWKIRTLWSIFFKVLRQFNMLCFEWWKRCGEMKFRTDSNNCGGISQSFIEVQCWYAVAGITWSQAKRDWISLKTLWFSWKEYSKLRYPTICWKLYFFTYNGGRGTRAHAVSCACLDINWKMFFSWFLCHFFRFFLWKFRAKVFKICHAF